MTSGHKTQWVISYKPRTCMGLTMWECIL